jgi:hypothetical protein
MRWNHNHNATQNLFYPQTLQTFSINASSDTAIGNNTVYVAKWGNDVSGNGSRRLPFRTVQKALDMGTHANIVIGDGVYLEDLVNSNGRNIIADNPGSVLFEGTGKSLWLIGTGTLQVRVFGCVVRNFPDITTNAGSQLGFFYSTVENTKRVMPYHNSGTRARIIFRSVFRNVTGETHLTVPTSTNVSYSTFINCRNIIISDPTNYNLYLPFNIFHKCNIQFSEATSNDYTCFDECYFRFSGSVNTSAELLYPPASGFTAATNISELRSLHLAGFAGAVYNFPNCKVGSPGFNNVLAGDFTLTLNSIARNMAYDGKFIGAKGLAGSQDAGDAVYTENVTISNGEATLTDVALPGLIRFPIVDLGAEYELGILDYSGVMGLRNGEAIDANKDLADNTINAGQNLTTNSSYLVEVGSINYNGISHQIGSRFTAVSAASTFSTTESGVVREIIERPNRYAVKMKVHRNDGQLNTFAALDWHLYSLGQKVTSNKVGDVGTGAIIRGNASLDFDASKSQPVFARYYQIELIISINNLRS